MTKGPVFQHRHYKAIAAQFAAMRYSFARPDGLAAYDKMLEAVSNMLARDNPRFDRARFLAASSGKPSNGRDKVK